MAQRVFTLSLISLARTENQDEFTQHVPEMRRKPSRSAEERNFDVKVQLGEVKSQRQLDYEESKKQRVVKAIRTGSNSLYYDWVEVTVNGTV